MIKQCNCKHTGQDKLYGKGMRIFNETADEKGKVNGCRCSVCNSKYDLHQPKKRAIKVKVDMA
jgi:hypothetical protein